MPFSAVSRLAGPADFARDGPISPETVRFRLDGLVFCKRAVTGDAIGSLPLSPCPHQIAPALIAKATACGRLRRLRRLVKP